MIIMVNLDTTIVNLALPQIANYLAAPLSGLQWIITIYLLVTTATFVLGGKLADHYGRKRVYLIGIIVFIAGSAAAGLAQNTWHLLLGRSVQAVGFAMTFTSVMILITSLFPESRRGQVLGIALVFSGLSQAIGPTLGGIILEQLSWRWIFYVNVPLGLLSFLLTWWFNPIETTEKKSTPIDYIGALILACGVSFIIIALNEVNTWGLTSAYFYGVLLLGIGLIALLVHHALHKTNPIIELHFFQNRAFLSTSLIRAIYTGNYLAILFILPIFMQNSLGYSPLKTSYYLIAMTLVFAVLAPIGGKWLDVVGTKKATLVSMLLLCGALICWIATPYLFTTLLLIAGLVLAGVASSLNMSSTMKAAMAEIPEKQQGVGLGLFYTITFLGGTLGVAIIGSFIGHFAQSYALQKAQDLALSTAELTHLEWVATGARPLAYLNEVIPAPLLEATVLIAKQSFALAFSSALFLNLLFCLVAVYCCRHLK